MEHASDWLKINLYLIVCITKKFQNSCQNDPDERQFASYVNVFMVRGICSNLCYPFGYHASTGFTADQLFPVVWEATYLLESMGFHVRTWVCDGASPNRKLFKICAADDNGNWTWNLFHGNEKICFISDERHLVKTTRNNMENSSANKNSRNLHVSFLLVYLQLF